MSAAGPSHPNASRHRTVALACAAFVAAMVGAAYAAVPLYSMFCKLTGFGGTPKVATSAPTRVVDRSFDIRFDANVNDKLGWTFQAEQPVVSVKAGEVKTIYYKVTNRGPAETRAVASYNVTPELTGAYFSKIQCFCFTDQSLKPGESMELPVVFFIDPSIVDDKSVADVHTITLSYTFFPAKRPATPVAAVEPSTERPKL